MNKKISIILLAALMLFMFAACGNSGTDSTTTEADKAETTVKSTAEVTEEVTEETTKAVLTYESIYEEYSAKLKEAAPILSEEYTKEAEALAKDITALAELSNAKTSKLAEISTEGIKKMAELKLKNGDSDATYEEWANKLTTLYTEEAKTISNAYMNSLS